MSSSLAEPAHVMSAPVASTLSARADLALADAFLRQAVRFTADRLRNAKSAGTQALGGWEEWRERGRATRAHTIAHLDHYLEQFAERAEERGMRVHFAADAAEARAIFLGIAAERGARAVVKSKSMVTEEVHLNAALAERGIECVETDLGEWIVQLAREMPSHIILPAIHKNRGQIRALFEAEGGQPLTEETSVLAAHARARLREKFLAADLGVSGCNFAVAETGSLAIFTNEGNGRMVTSLPPTHVVFLGMERVVPGWADLELMANLLPRSATGQKITTYLHVIGGPRRAREADGPAELHVIVLDNGRSAQLGDPRFQEILHCIRCGACLNVCPVYRQIGGHAYGSVYPGPIGAVLTPLLEPERDQAAELAGASSLCGACREACPVKIPLDDMLVALRARNVERGRAPLSERAAMRLFAFVAARPRLFALAGGTARRMAGLIGRVGAGRAWTSTRALPALPARSFRDQWEEIEGGP
jgi:L-lactate dehydrogenase complex protein LldF